MNNSHTPFIRAVSTRGELVYIDAYVKDGGLVINSNMSPSQYAQINWVRDFLIEDPWEQAVSKLKEEGFMVHYTPATDKIVATQAYYCRYKGRGRGMVEITLSNDIEICIPLEMILPLKSKTTSRAEHALEKVKVVDDGEALEWKEEGIKISLAPLFEFDFTLTEG